MVYHDTPSFLITQSVTSYQCDEEGSYLFGMVSYHSSKALFLPE